MKTLVIAKRENGVWLADHLGCTLYQTESSVRQCKAGNGIVVKADQIQNVWDAVIFADSIQTNGQSLSCKLYGKTPIQDQMEKSPVYGATLLEGCGIRTDDGQTEGIEIGVMGWYEDGGWMGSQVFLQEQRGFMNRDLGERLPEAQGITLKSIPFDSVLIQETLKKIEPLCKDYNGPVCMRITVSQRGIYGRGIRFGFLPGWVETLLELQRGPILKNPFMLNNSVACGILVSIPPYPYSDMNPTEEVGIQAQEPSIKHLRFYDVCQFSKSYHSAGCSGKLFFATAWGEDAYAAKMRIYRSLRNIEIPNIQYRTDIASQWEEAVERLKAFQVI